MRTAIGMLVAGLVAAAAVSWMLSRHPPREVPAVTCRQLADSPAAYEGRTVRVSSAGCLRGGDPRELIYRKFFADRPAVVCRFPGDVPIPTPDSFVGVVTVADGTVLVVDCRP